MASSPLSRSRAGLSSAPPGEATGRADKRRGSPADDFEDTVGGDQKRIKLLGDASCGSGLITLNDDRQLPLSNEEIPSLLFSCHPRGAGNFETLDSSKSRQNVQQISLFKLELVKHKIFLCHSGAQKDFVEQLCVDLEARGYLFPFFDCRHHSLPKGKDFVPLIKEAAQLCHVAVVVLSKEFLSSKWPMIELAEFHAAQTVGNQQLNLLPLFFKLSIDDLDDWNIANRWMPIWEQHANNDRRIDLNKWRAAVRALLKANGLVFGKNAMSEVAYRKDVVRSIFRLSPPDLLNGSSRDVVGYDRICQEVSSQFVKDRRVGAQVLGLYGTGGIGKTTLSRALCDYFYGGFLGKVCYLDLGEASRMRRQELMLQALCGFERDVLDRITDVGQGLTQMEACMKRDPVFLVIDNVTDDVSLRKEARDYLMVGFHPESRIMITSRSQVLVQDLLPDVEFCMRIPNLTEDEAGAIFLRSAAPMQSISMLTGEERIILHLCIQQCWFPMEETEEGESWSGSYHPLALSALGDFFYRFTSNAHMLLWKEYLERNVEPLKDVWKSSNIFRILGLQFSTFHPSEQLVFLDMALYGKHMHLHSYSLAFKAWVEWLSGLHEETPTVVERKLLDLKRSGMINWSVNWDGTFRDQKITMHDLYRKFAEWLVTSVHEVKGLKNVWGVFQTAGTNLRCDSPASKCWSDLVRLRIFDLTRANARLVAGKAMQELCNLALLQLHSCTNLAVLNLRGLDCLRHLELVKLTKLCTITLTGNSSTDVDDVGMFDSLQFVLLEGLDSLTHVPDLRSCTSLQSLVVRRCSKLTNFEAIECPHLKVLTLSELVPHQFGRLPNFKSLHSLESLRISAVSDVDGCAACWEHWGGYPRDWPGTYDAHIGEDSEVRLEGLEPCHKLLEELLLYMSQWKRLSCSWSDHQVTTLTATGN